MGKDQNVYAALYAGDEGKKLIQLLPPDGKGNLQTRLVAQGFCTAAGHDAQCRHRARQGAPLYV